MERRSEFRGKRIDNDKWVYGFYTKDQNGNAYIVDLKSDPKHKSYPFIMVNPLTVGEFAVVNERKESVYEDDLFRQELETDEGDIRNYLVVVWVRQRGAFYLVPVEHYPIMRDNDVSEEIQFGWLFQDAPLYDFSIDVGLTKVGNIHEDSNLYTLDENETSKQL